MPFDPARSPETDALVALLRAVPLGDTVAYAALSQAIGRDVTGPCRAHLVSARRIAARDDGAIFVPVRGQGLRRLMPDEAPDIGAATRRRQRRSARAGVRAMKALAAASNGLAPEAGRRLSHELAVQGLIAELSTDRAAAAMPSPAQGQPPAPPALAARAFLEATGASLPAAPDG